VADGAPARYGEPERPRLAPDGLPLHAPAHGFSQVNAAVNARLQALVLELAGAEGARVLELYAGHGNFTCALAARASALSAVEGDAPAAQACRENLRARGLSEARVSVADVQSLELREHFDVIVLDPPRAGCAALPRLAQQSRAASVVYISCHMTTLSRDLRALSGAGYVVDRAHALDMFPQTGHVEAVVRMHRLAR
jgi:23S rRNA (uracil1939-C5)-methyltransferase